MKRKTIRKPIAAILALALVLSAFIIAPAAYAEEESYVNELIRGSYYAEDNAVYFNIEKLSEFDGTIYTALYDADGNLVDAAVGETAGSFTGLSEVKYLLKAFVWDENQAPLCEPLEINVFNSDYPIVSGIIIGNEITELDGPVDSNKIKVLVTGCWGNKNPYDENLYQANEDYEFYDMTGTAGDYLGYSVDMSVARLYDSDVTGTIEAIMVNANTSVESFTLNSFRGIDDNTLTFEDSKAVTLSDDASIVYNGIGGYNIDWVFEPVNSNGGRYIIETATGFGGKITAISNDGDDKADVVIVQLDESGVVDYLAGGLLLFKNEVGSRRRDNAARIDFSDSDAYIEITKGGEPYDYTQLKEWDILSVTANTGFSRPIYKIDVLTAEEAIAEGTVTAVEYSEGSWNGYIYTIDGSRAGSYMAAENAFMPNAIREERNVTFYIDKYGKIAAALVKKEEPKYAYILDTAIVDGSFGERDVAILFMYMDGTINAARLNDEVTVYNPTPQFGSRYSDYTIYQYKKYSDEEIYEVLDSIVGKVVTMRATDGCIKTLTLPYTDNYGGEADVTLSCLGRPGTYDYNQDTGIISIFGRRYEITDDTLVFFIGEIGDDFAYNTPVKGDDVYRSGVAKGSDLETMSSGDDANKTAVAYAYENDSGTVDVLVVYNSYIPKDPEAMDAVIVDINVKTVDNKQVLDVLYLQDGKYAWDYTDGLEAGDLNQNTQPGTIFTFEFGEKGVITSAHRMLSYEEFPPMIEDGEDFTTVGIPNFTVTDEENVILGALIGRENGVLRIAPMKDGKPDTDNIIEYALDNPKTKYYFFTQWPEYTFIEPGSYNDMLIDPVLTNDGLNGSYEIEYGGVKKPAPAWGMMDYVYIRERKTNSDVVMYSRKYNYSYSGSPSPNGHKPEFCTVLNVELVDTGQGMTVPIMKLSAESGEKILYFNNQVKITNPTDEIKTLIGTDSDVVYWDRQAVKDTYAAWEAIKTLIGMPVDMTIINDSIIEITLRNDLPKTETSAAIVTGVEQNEDGTLNVTYYLDSVLKSASTTADFKSADLTAETQPGTPLKLGITGGKISSAEAYIVFDGEIRTDILSGGDNPGVPKVKTIRSNDWNDDIYFGAIVDNTNGLSIARFDKNIGLPDFRDISRLFLHMTVHCYLYDPETGEISVGNLDRIYADPYLAGDRGESTGYTIKVGDFSSLNPVPGMLDYVFIKEHTGTMSADVVVYKQRQYDYYVD